MPSVFIVSLVAISFASPLKKQKEKKKRSKDDEKQKEAKEESTLRTSSFASYRRFDSTAGRATTPGLTCRSMKYTRHEGGVRRPAAMLTCNY